MAKAKRIAILMILFIAFSLCGCSGATIVKKHYVEVECYSLNLAHIIIEGEFEFRDYQKTTDADGNITVSINFTRKEN